MPVPASNRRVDEPEVSSRVGLAAEVRPRPPLFRALGASEPPLRVEINGQPYHRERIFKHDSWAATALYQSAVGSQRAICKFNRRQPIGPIPMSWLGWWLARNERTILDRMADHPGVPRCLGDVVADRQILSNAVSRAYIEGRPLGRRDQVDDAFFPGLQSILEAMHRRGLAYVDLHKRENVLVGDDGRPYLIDFQISFAAPAGWRRYLPWTAVCLRILQRSDDYHLAKMWARSRPDQAGGEASVVRPWWIRAHRLVAQPFRSLRRKLLVKKGIRSGQGRATSEHFTEEALRSEAATATRLRS